MKPEVNFRKIEFGSDAYREALQLRHEVLRAPIGLNLYEEDLSKESDERHFGLFGANDVLVACVTAVPLSPAAAKLRQMAVSAAHQRKGYGQRIIRCLEDRLARDGVAEISMHARVSAVSFYQRLGYSMDGDPFTEVGIPHVRMRKRITSSSGAG